jgi:O-antigen/teichoic acid export membrane protein
MIKNNKKSYRIINDTLYTFFSAFLPLLFIQFFLFPSLSLRFSPENYGFILTIYSIISFTGLNIGSAINNSRLINDNKLIYFKSFNDYCYILIIFTLINIFLTVLLLGFFAGSLQTIDYFLIVLVSSLTLLTTYLQVSFRIKLKFNLIFLNSVLYIIGLLIGYLIYMITDYWIFIFLVGSIFSFLFLYYSTFFKLEKKKKSPFFRHFLKETFFHFFSTVLISIGIYVDKIILFPLLGGSLVSFYYVSSLLGKSLSLIIGPISSVFLTYLSKLNNISKKSFFLLVIVSIVISFLSYFIIIFISQSFLEFLYPNLYLYSLPYLSLSTISQLLFIAGSFLNPIIIRFYKANIQFYLNLIYATIYLVLGIPMILFYGLTGFIFSTIIVNSIRFLFIVLFFYFNNSFNKEVKYEY